MMEQPGESVDDRKSKAKPPLAVALGIKSIELVEYFLPLIQGDSRSRVPHLNAQFSAPFSAAHDHAAMRRVADSIGYQIENDALEQDEVAAQPSLGRGDPK